MASSGGPDEADQVVDAPIRTPMADLAVPLLLATLLLEVYLALYAWYGTISTFILLTVAIGFAIVQIERRDPSAVAHLWGDFGWHDVPAAATSPPIAAAASQEAPNAEGSEAGEGRAPD